MTLQEKDVVQEYSLLIHPKDLQALKSDVWSDETVPAKLKIDKKYHEIEIVYRGNYTRDLPRKSYRFECKKNTTLFGSREMHWNAEYRDISMIRNKLSFEFFKSIGAYAPEANHVLLKLNGMVHGLYLQIESVDDLFLKKRKLPLGAIYYASNDDANFSLLNPDHEAKQSLEDGYTRKLGCESDDGYLRQFICFINTCPRMDFANEIVKYLDVEMYLRWLIGVVCTQNYDGFIQNYALYLNQSTGQFSIIPWDYDATWGRNFKGKVMVYDYVPITGYNTLTARILDVPEFRLQYRQMLEMVLETLFTLEYLEPGIISLHESIRPYILLDPYRKETVNEFDAEVEYILTFILNRNRYLREQLATLVD